MKIIVKAINILILIVTLLVSACVHDGFEKEKYGNCSDNIQNQNEQGVDCGGYCVPCSSCDDGETNASETGIDCGGLCASCEPSCSVPAGTVDYTIFPSGFSSGYDNSESGGGYFSPNFSEIRIDYSQVLTRIVIEFQDNFNPYSYVPVNQTMVFKTVNSTDFSIDKKSKVKVTYYGNVGFSSYSGALLKDQNIYITHFEDKKIQIRFCEAKASKDILSLNAISILY